MKYRIVIADDHPIFRNGIRDIINGLAWAEVVGEAGNGLDAYKTIINQIPDLAVLDLEMPMLSGLDVCKKILSEKHFTRFIILTMHKEKHFFDEAMNIGVMGYLLKDNAIDELLTAIRTVKEGKQYVSPLIESYLTVHQAVQQLPDGFKELHATLTPTEKVILKLIAQSKTSQEIADNIFISPNTVDNHRANITRKLKLEGKNSLLKFAIQYSGML